MSPEFVIFCIVAFLIPVVLCFYYKHVVNEQSTELKKLKEKEEQAFKEFMHSIREDGARIEEAWKDVLLKAGYDMRPKEHVWKREIVDFLDRKAVLISFKMTDTYKGLIEGDLAYASKEYWYSTLQEYSKEGYLLLEPQLVRSWGQSKDWSLPQYKVEIEVYDGVARLWLCWFTTDAAQASLADFVNETTRTIDFSAHCIEFYED